MEHHVDLACSGIDGLVADTERVRGPVLVVSPHLDDAVLSVGATLACLTGMGSTVEVLTLFAGEPTGDLSEPAKHFHDLCGHPYDGSAIAARKEEDRLAMETLGARWCHAGFLDAVYRVDRDGQWLCANNQAMFAGDLSDETELVNELSEYIGSKCEDDQPDVIFTCSANGRHVDHRHTFAAAAAAARQTGASLLAWEDLPYAVGSAPVPPIPRLTEIRVAAEPESWNVKWKAISAYASQVYMLWGDADWISVLDGHALSRGGTRRAEVLWRVPDMDLRADPVARDRNGGE